jgi:hypothetical protein
MNFEPRPFDLHSSLTGHMDVIAVESQLPKLARQIVQFKAEVEHRADKHIAADSAKNIQIQSLHLPAPQPSAFIWLAA